MKYSELITAWETNPRQILLHGKPRDPKLFSLPPGYRVWQEDGYTIAEETHNDLTLDEVRTILRFNPNELQRKSVYANTTELTWRKCKYELGDFTKPKLEEIWREDRFRRTPKAKYKPYTIETFPSDRIPWIVCNITGNHHGRWLVLRVCHVGVEIKGGPGPKNYVELTWQDLCTDHCWVDTGEPVGIKIKSE